MKLLKIISRLCIFTSLVLASLEYTYALPPVDFVMQIVANIWIYVSMWVALIAAFITSTYRLFQWFYSKYKIWIIVWSILVVVLSTTVILEFTAKSEIDKLFKEKEVKLIEWLYSWEKVVSNLETNKEFLNKIDIKSFIKSDYLITNDEFKNLLSSNREDVFILDWREDIEYEMWHISWAIQMRAADLKHEQSWKGIPTNKVVVVTCWTWMRWKVIRDYITSKWFEARFLENWIESWLEVEWEFEWEEDLNKVYPDKKYKFNLSADLVKKYKENGAIIIDVREEYITDKDIIEGVIMISEMNTPTRKMNKLLDTIKKTETVLVLCDDPINCYDANMIGVKLEKRWIEFLGRFSRDAIVVPYTDVW